MDYTADERLSQPSNERLKNELCEFIKSSWLIVLNEECDKDMLQYITVMIYKGKSMSEIAADLDAFLGGTTLLACNKLYSIEYWLILYTEKSLQFVTRYDNYS